MPRFKVVPPLQYITMLEEPTTPMTCKRCGKRFNTGAWHPRKYCSIACEEGRSPLPQSDPRSEGYHLHLQSEPESLVGKTLVGKAFKRTCYSPDWHRDPEDYKPRNIVEHDEENEVITYQKSIVIGEVVRTLSQGTYLIERDNPVSTGVSVFQVDISKTVEKIRRGEWWADG